MQPFKSASFHQTFIQLFVPISSHSSDKADDYIDFPLGEISTFEDFETHCLYSDIKKQFLLDITTIKIEAHQYVGEQFDAAISIFYAKINDPSDEAVRFNLLLIYRDTRFEIHRLAQKLKQGASFQQSTLATNHPRVSEEINMSKILDRCLTGIDLCFPGIHSRFAGTILRLESSENSLQSTLFRLKNELFHSCIEAFLIDLKRNRRVLIQDGMEIHWFNKLYNLYCENLGFPKIKDRYIPTHQDEKLIEEFISSCICHINEFLVVREIARESSELLTMALKQEGVLAWEKESISSVEMTNERLTVIDTYFLTPLNSLLNPGQAQALTLWDVLEGPDDNDTYKLIRHKEKLLAWISQTLIEASPLVLTPISSHEENNQYIGAISSLFYWVFESKHALHENNVECKFHSDNHISVKLSHLKNILFSTWPRDIYSSLLMQALIQTDSPEEIALFYLNNSIKQELSKIEKAVTDKLSYLLNEKMIQNSTFKIALSTLILEHHKERAITFPMGYSLLLSDFKWFINTDLLEFVLCSLQQEEMDISLITNSLDTLQISSFSSESIKMLFEADDCIRLFQQAFNLTQCGIMQILLNTGHCDELAGSSNEQGESPLHLASKFGHVECVRSLLEIKNIYVNTSASNGWTALHCAANSGSVECLKLLLNCQRLSVNLSCLNGWRALHLAAKKGFLECLNLLLKCQDIDVNVSNIYGWTALHLAVDKGSVECIKLLLNVQSINVNAKTKKGTTALLLAITNDKFECFCRLLKEKNFDVNASCTAGWTPLLMALKKRSVKWLEPILNTQGVNVNVSLVNGWTGLHYAVEMDAVECFNLLLKCQDIDVNAKSKDGSTALSFASMKGKTECVSSLLKKEDIDVNASDLNGWTALHHAANQGSAGCLKLLLNAKGINVNAKTNDKFTALTFAIESKNRECTYLLLDHPDTNLKCISSSVYTFLCVNLARYGYKLK